MSGPEDTAAAFYRAGVEAGMTRAACASRCYDCPACDCECDETCDLDCHEMAAANRKAAGP